MHAHLFLNKECKNPDVDTREFNLWTAPDCVGTEFENCNRTWFYFSTTIFQPLLIETALLVKILYVESETLIGYMEAGRGHISIITPAAVCICQMLLFALFLLSEEFVSY